MLSQLGLRARRRELIWILVVNEEDVWSEASPFLRGTVMKAAEDLLLYPLMTDDHPVCPRCSLPLALVGFQGERGKPAFSSSDVQNADAQKPFLTTTTTTGHLRSPPNTTEAVPPPLVRSRLARPSYANIPFDSEASVHANQAPCINHSR
jgi:hypothetical protein